jgi:hypothetical protein
VKRDAGWGAALLVAVAALFGVSSRSSDRQPADSENGRAQGVSQHHSRQPAAAGQPKELPEGPCSEIEERLADFFGFGDGVYVVPAQCFPKSLNIPTSQRFDPSSTAGLKFVIATLPDPLHTHFSLAFDRMAEALQQGVQDGGYFYDSSWLPWESEEQNLNNLSDQDSANQRHEAQENEPGILLFRGQTPKHGKADSPFHGGLWSLWWAKIRQAASIAGNL